MSTTVDSKVVEMRFDNSHFEHNVSNTMSTLDKLKQKLNFSGGTKGLENVGNAAKKVDMSGLSTGIDTIQTKFSAMQVVGVTALANITNSAVNAGKRMIESLTIAPIRDGFNEYEMTLNAIQTTMAATGKTSKQVSEELKKLDEYADKTVYSTADMLNNLPKFTNAGVELESATKAMIGIANATALAGGDAGKASIAFYNLGQAIGTGYLTRMDYNSINNAGIATMEWKNQMVDAAIAAGTLTKAGDDLYKAGGKTFTLQQLFIDGLQHQWATTDVMMKVFGDYGDETTEIGKKSYAAAQDIKTFSMMMDSLKATAGTGWKDTWQIIFGDLEEAKVMWTGLTNFISNIITKFADFRNTILESALGKGFGKLSEGIKSVLDGVSKVTAPVESAIDSISGITKTLAEHNAVVNEVINGKWGNMQKRWDALTDAGYDWVYVQNKVNEKLGNSKRRTSAYTEALAKQGDATDKTVAKQTKLEKSDAELLASLCKLSDEQLLQAGYTKEQIAALRELQSIADKLGLSIEDLVNNIDEIDGRWLLLNSFKNLGNALVGVGKAIKDAWKDIFPEATMESIADAIFNAIAAFHKFTMSLRLVNDDTGELNDNGLKLQRTFKGIFAAIDIVLTILGGPLKIVFKALTQLLGVFNINLLDVTAVIGDALVGLRDFIDGALDFTGLFKKIVGPIKNAIKTFQEWTASLRESEDLPRDIAIGIANGFGKAFDAVKNFVKSIPGFIKSIPELFSSMFDGTRALPGWISYFEIAGETIAHLGNMIREKIVAFLSRSEFAGISADSISGLVQGFKSGAAKAWNAAVEMVTNLVEKVKGFLGIHSPSTVFMAIGGFIIAGLVAGLKNGIPDSLGAVKDVIQPIIDWLQTIDFGAILAGIVGIGSVSAANKIGDALGAFASPIEGLGEVFAGAGKVMDKSARPIAKVIKSTAKVVKGFGKILNSVAFSIRVDAIKTLATTLLMLVGAVIVLTFFDPLELLAAAGIILVLAGILVGLAWATNKISSASATIGKDGLNIQGLSSGLLGIGAAILLMGITLKMIGELSPEQAKSAFLRLAGLIVSIMSVVVIFGLLVKGKQAQNIDKFGVMMTKMAGALLLMVVVIKLCGLLKENELLNALAVFGMFATLVTVMGLISMFTGKNIEKMGSMMVKMSTALLLMVAVIKLSAGLEKDELLKGVNFLIVFAGFVAVMSLISKIGGSAIAGLGKMLLGVSLAMLILVGVMKLVGMLTVGEMIKGGIAIAAFGVMIALLVKSVMKNGKDAPKVAGMILAFAVAIAILAAVAVVCSLISLPGLVKGIAAVGALTLMMSLLIAATRGANDVKGNIIAITVAIGLLVAAVALLTLIDPVKLAITTGLVSVLMGVFALVIKVAGSANKAMGAIIAMSGAIALIGGVLYLLATLPIESTMGSAIALGGLMLVMTGVLALMIPIGSMAKQALAGIGALALLAVPLALVGLILAMMTALNVSDALTNAAALSVLLVSMSLVCALMSKIPVSAAVTGALGLAAFIGIMAGVLLIAGGLSRIPGFNELIADGGATLALIGHALGAFVGSIVAGFAGAALTILPALGHALSGFMAGVTPFIEGVKNVDASVLAGAGILVAALLAFTVAELLAGVAALSGLGLVALGLELSAFMIAATPFITGASAITPESMAGIKALAEAILILTAANVIEGLTSLFGGGNSLANFASQLPILGQGLAAFSSSLGSFTEDQLATVNCAAKAVKTLASAAAEIPNTGGLLASIVGDNDLGVFASQFPILGSGLAQFLSNIGTFTEEQVATVNCAASAIKTLAQASSEIPNTGGWLGAIVGENDLGPFASQFPILGSGLRGFLDNVGTFTDEQVATVDCASQAIKTLAQASSEIPNTGGWLGAIVGENDLGTFASQFPVLGKGISGFLTNIGTFTDEQVATVTCAANAIKVLAQASSSIPNAGGLLAAIVGDNDLGTFASQLPKVGEGVKGFTDKLGSFDDTKVATVNSAIKAINALSGLANADLSSAKKHLSDFGDDLPGFAEDLASFCSSMPNTTSTTSAVSNLNKIIRAVKSIENANSGCLATFADNLKKIGEDAVKKFVNAFTSSSAKTDLEKAATSLAEKAVDGAETQNDDMESAGKDLGSGLVQGINSKKTAAYNAGYALGQMAVQGEKDGQQSKSPSKLTIQAGKWLGEGLVIGIGKMGNRVYSAGHTLGETATDALSTTISRISNLVTSDIDAQPTIRPVLDLSDVRAGTGVLAGMLNMDSSVGVHANVGAISSMMSLRGQNGATNSDVVAAIDGLRKDLSNLGGPSYQINGVTYDDGSNISNAVQAIVRAAKIERRV
jgi:hypothetical protein